MTVLLWIPAFAFGYAGFALLALAVERHRRVLRPASRPWSPAVRRLLQIGGAGCLGLSLGTCAAMQGASTGLVSWTGLLTVGAFAVLGQISWRTAQHKAGR